MAPGASAWHPIVAGRRLKNPCKCAQTAPSCSNSALTPSPRRLNLEFAQLRRAAEARGVVEHREPLLREARTAARLRHPNIVPIHAVEEASDFVFFTMDYVEGETLAQRVGTRGPLAVGEATRILHDVARAVGYAHARGVIHRDVKPDNIIIEEGSGRALVMDFGIAQVQAQPEDGRPGCVAGTAPFMSPELVQGGRVDERSDVYALAVYSSKSPSVIRRAMLPGFSSMSPALGSRTRG